MEFEFLLKKPYSKRFINFNIFAFFIFFLWDGVIIILFDPSCTVILIYYNLNYIRIIHIKSCFIKLIQRYFINAISKI